jgi:hypothetical protein
MSYREENGQVVLTMSAEDFGTLLMAIGALMAYTAQGKLPIFTMDSISAFMNRLNEGNPNYTPYEVPDGKAS